MTEKIYMDNSYLTELNANVLMNKKVGDNYQLILDKTIFYPEGAGGQKGDIGTINGVKVEKSILEDDKIIHITKEKVPGSTVDIKIDWEQRHHIMIQHTTQHLVSSCFYRLFGIQTLSFHASDDYIYIDLDVEDLDKEKIENVEDLANDIIRNNFTVKTYYPDEESKKSINFRRVPKVDHNLRVVEIDSFDFAACGGTHVKSTGEIGLVKIIENKRQNGKTRIKVASGKIALKDYRIKNEISLFFMEELSGNENNIYDKYNKYEESNEELKEENKSLRLKLNDLIKEKASKNIKTIGDKNVLIYEFLDLDFKDSNSFVKSFENENIIIALYKINGEKVNYLISSYGYEDINLNDLASKMRENYNMKGGGNKNSIQGIFFIDKNEDVNELLFKELKSIIKIDQN